jgi:hypothetical protein
VASGNASDPYYALKVAGHSYQKWGYDGVKMLTDLLERLVNQSERWQVELKGYGLGYFEQSLAAKEVARRRLSLVEAEACFSQLTDCLKEKYGTAYDSGCEKESN